MNPIIYKITKAKYQKMFEDDCLCDKSIHQNGDGTVKICQNVDLESFESIAKDVETEVRLNNEKFNGDH